MKKKKYVDDYYIPPVTAAEREAIIKEFADELRKWAQVQATKPVTYR